MVGTTAYLHTLNGQPAFFDGEVVCFIGHYGPSRPVARSLRQIRREQAKSFSKDVLEGFDPKRFKYGYVKVRF